MNVNLIRIEGNWDVGYVLDKQTLSSVFLGNSASGRPQFDTTRTEVGEAVYLLKYKDDFTQVELLAEAVVSNIFPHFKDATVVIPMPFSKERWKQPVYEVAKKVCEISGLEYREDLLIKNKNTSQMKDMVCLEDKNNALVDAFKYDNVLDKKHSIIIIDDLFDSGTSLKFATEALRKYSNIDKIYIAALTRTKG